MYSYTLYVISLAFLPPYMPKKHMSNEKIVIFFSFVRDTNAILMFYKNFTIFFSISAFLLLDKNKKKTNFFPAGNSFKVFYPTCSENEKKFLNKNSNWLVVVLIWLFSSSNIHMNCMHKEGKVQCSFLVALFPITIVARVKTLIVHSKWRV